MAENRKFIFLSECCGEKYNQETENEFGQRYTCQKCGEVCNIKKIENGNLQRIQI